MITNESTETDMLSECTCVALMGTLKLFIVAGHHSQALRKNSCFSDLHIENDIT